MKTIAKLDIINVGKFEVKSLKEMDELVDIMRRKLE
jgi:hypothetical protein